MSTPKGHVRISSGEERTYLLQRNPKCKPGVSRLVQSFLEPKILSLPPFQLLKGKKKKKDSHKSREQRQNFPFCFSSSSANFGVMLLKTRSWNENFFIFHLCLSPRRVRSCRISSWSSSGEDPRNAALPGRGSRRAGTGGQQSSGDRSPGTETTTNSGMTPQSFETAAQGCRAALNCERMSENPNKPELCCCMWQVEMVKIRTVKV